MTIGRQIVARRRQRAMSEFLAAGGQLAPFSSPPPPIPAGAPAYYGTGVRPFVPVAGASIGAAPGARTARYGGVTPASAKSASLVRHYEAALAGYSAGAWREGYMNAKNAQEIQGYAAELLGRIDQAKGLPPWAEHKLAVARTHVSDVAHYVRFAADHGDERHLCAQVLSARDADSRAAAAAAAPRVPGELSPAAQSGYDRPMDPAGYSAGAPISPSQAAAMRGVLQEHGYAAGSVQAARQRRQALLAMQANRLSDGFSVGRGLYGDGLHYGGQFYPPSYLEQAGGPQIARLRRIALIRETLARQ